MLKITLKKTKMRTNGYLYVFYKYKIISIIFILITRI